MPRSRLLVLCVAALLSSSGCGLLAQPAPPQPGPTEANVVYGEAGGEKLLLDIYQATTPGLHPALMMIHGGGWSGGDKAGDRGGAVGLSRAGITCFSINYRLAPKFVFPAQVQDVARAVRWVRANAAKYSIDPNRIGAQGGSAGGHLSLMLGVIEPGDFQDPEDPNRALSAKVQCVVDYFGPSDFTGPLGVATAAAYAHLRRFLGETREEAPDKWRDASPITHVTKSAAPTLMIHGDADKLVPLSQSEVMKAALDKVGVENQLVVVHNGGHGFGGAEKAEIAAAYKAAAEFLMKHLLTANGERRANS